MPSVSYRRMVNILHKKMVQYDFVEWHNQVTIRTFNRHVYKLLENLWVQDITTGQYHRLSEIYYMIRSVKTLDGELIARRKNLASDLWVQDVAMRDNIVDYQSTGIQKVN